MPKKTARRIIDTRKDTGTTIIGGVTLSGGSSGGAATPAMAGDGLTYNSGVLDVGAGTLITVGADSVGITAGANYQFIGTGSGTAAAWQNLSTLAGSGLTHSAGVLAVGAGNGITVAADSVALTTPGTLTVSTSNNAASNHTHAITSSSNPGAAASILASDASGYLNLVRLVLSDRLRTPLIDTASGNLTLQPAGDITIDPVGNDVLPATNYDINLGALSKKYLTLHAAELWVETLVAQNTIATIGGRILVGPTTYLSRDMGTGDTTIYVRHNQMVSGDRAYMEANGSVEFFAITSGPTTISATEYSYTVTRNLDGSGANAWYAGDAMFNTGQTGNGFIDLYSIRGVKTASQAGPTIVGNVRNSSTYNDWSEAWAIGNLNGLYGYGANTVGVGLGKYASGQPNIVIDPTNGVRLRQYTTDLIVLDPSGNSYFAGVMTIGTGGEIRQGTGTLGSNYTGLRIWRDTNVGRIGGYASNVLQWYGDTAGNLVAGTGYVTLNASGIDVASYHDSLTSTPEPGYSDPISNPSAALTYHATDQGEAWYSAVDGWKTYNGGTALRLFGSSRHAVDSGQYASSWTHYVDAVLEMPGVTKPSGAGTWYERLWLKSPSTYMVMLNGMIGINTASLSAVLNVPGLIYTNATQTETVFSGAPGLDNANLSGSDGYWALRTGTDNRFAVDVYNSASPVEALAILQDGHLRIRNATWLGAYNSAGAEQPLIRSRGMGYSASTYPGIQVGQTGDHIALFVDPGGVTGGSFSGNTNELLLPNHVRFVQANSGGTDWIEGMRIDNGLFWFGNTSNLYSAKIQTNGNIHAQGAVTSEMFLQMMSASTPSAATGFARMWYDGTNIKVILPGGTTKTLSWT